jgi:hypothetical protein
MKSSKSQAPESLEVEGYEGHFDDLDGYTVGFENYTADADLAPFFAGLPDDRCQCPHWGYVLKGRLTFRYADGTEDTMESGDAYYARPGHTPVLYAGTEVVEFSPTSELQATLDVVNKNMESMDA